MRRLRDFPIQFSNSSRQLTPSLPGLTRQSIFFEK
jgi:hypothetical protein